MFLRLSTDKFHIVGWVENPRVTGSIPVQATSNFEKARPLRWAFCFAASGACMAAMLVWWRRTSLWASQGASQEYPCTLPWFSHCASLWSFWFSLWDPYAPRAYLQLRALCYVTLVT